nr:hypothetical protein [Candidatus Palauibacterales bacterium]
GTTEVYVDESIRYAAVPLQSYGTWVYVRGVRAWRPHVGYGWRPYSRGRWRYTPTGLFWVSYEPWGWVPHHYGNWDLVPGYGWVWFPGRRFASAWVFWYWGPRYVGWVPWGYYSNHYGGRYGLSFAVYGWAGGPAARFGDWCFTPLNRFGHRHQQRYIRTGRALGRDGDRIEKGIITTDTRRLTPGHWTSPDQVDRMLTLDDGGKHFEPEDVSPFVYREKDARLPERRGTSTAQRSDPARPSIDPVRTTRAVELASTPREMRPRDIATGEITTRDPKPRDITPRDTGPRVITPRQPTTREKAQRAVDQRASIDPVRTTRAVELASTPREMTPRDVAPREIKARDPKPRDIAPRDTGPRVITPRQPTTREKAQRAVDQRASIDPVRTTRPVRVAPSAPRGLERPSAGGTARKPTRSKPPEAVRRTSPVGSPSPRRVGPAKAAPGSVRSPSRSKTTSPASPRKTRSR